MKFPPSSRYLITAAALGLITVASCAWSQNQTGRQKRRPGAAQAPNARPNRPANARNYPVGETLNVRDFGAKGDGQTDDTAAIRRAMEAILERKRAKLGTPLWTAGHHTLYLPDGTYLVSGPLTFGGRAEVAQGRKAATGLLQREIHVQGQSRAGTIIRLKDGAFPDAARPQTVFSFYDGGGANNVFATTFEDATIDTGRNRGAVALNFHNNNFGSVRRVTLKGDGTCGLNLGSNLSGIGLITDVEVQGFDYGIINGGQLKICYVLENIALSGQTKAGIWSKDKGLSVRRLTSDNSVPALVQRSQFNEDNGLVVLVDSILRGGAANVPAVENANGWIVARGLQTSGYGATLRDHGKNVTLKPGEEHVTGGALSLWDDAPKRTLNLPVEDAPVIPQDAPAQIAIVDGSHPDDTRALQAAIDSGKTTVQLPRGQYTLTDTIVLRGNVRRLDCDWSLVDISAFKDLDKPVFRVADGSAPAVVIEKIDTRPGSGARGGKARFVEQATSRALILRDLEFQGVAAYRNTVPGKLFVEGVVTASTAQPGKMTNVPGWEFTKQKVWARHINHEGNYPHFVNDGGQVWILGFKGGEGHGPYFRAVNGGQTEVLGGIFNNLDNQDSYPAGTADVEVVDSDVSISGLETSTSRGGQGPSPVTVRETRGGQTRTLKPDAAPRRENKTLNARALPLFVSRRSR